MSETYSGEGNFGGTGRKYRAYLNVYTENLNEYTTRVHWYTEAQEIASYLYGLSAYIWVNGSYCGGNSGVLYSNPGQSWKCVASVGWGYTDFSRSNNAYNISVTGRAQAEEVNGYGGGNGGHQDATITVTIPARPYTAHSSPTISAAKTTANYGESVQLSWSKGSTQGNANFDRFELWQGSNKLYSGSGVAYNVKPSDVTGAKGGTVTYKLKEIHEWYGSYPSKETSITLTVRSGVVTAYDSGGTKHTALVTAYDASGNSHYVLITAYDSNGTPHSVV